MIELREYQHKAVSSIWDYFAEKDGHPLVVIPTGGGKSLVIGAFCQGVLQSYPSTRIANLTHSRELVGQNEAELREIWPDAPTSIYSAGLKKRDLSGRILFAGIQSVYKRAYELQDHGPIDLVLIDEAHMLSRNDSSMYHRFLTDLHVINPHLKVIGLTATPFRLDSGLLHVGAGRLFTDLCHETSVKELVELGFLSPPITRKGQGQVSTVGVGTRGGEYIAAQLEASAIDPRTVETIAADIVEKGVDRHGWLVFTVGARHCELMRDALREHGTSVEMVLGTTPGGERAEILAAYKRREIRALVNMNVLTTGFNARHVDMIAVIRPTKSTGLWIQMIGRGTRLSPETGKRDCLVLDYGSNIARHGPIDAPIVQAMRKAIDERGQAPTKICPECQVEVHTGYLQCPGCGFEFPPVDRLVKTEAEHGALLSGQVIPAEWVRVTAVQYFQHNKVGSPPSLKVVYAAGLNRYPEWIGIERQDYGRTKAAMWWRGRAGPDSPVPSAVADALGRTFELRVPTEIQIKKRGQYIDVVGYRFAQF